jgi:hypothetical protein
MDVMVFEFYFRLRHFYPPRLINDLISPLQRILLTLNL